MLPLVSGSPGESDGYPGWCTYTYANATPELEVMCSGINAKTPRAGAIWRQGHLVHFGFHESPAKLNAIGRRLLVNSICYAWRFSEDRPIARTPSPFAVKGRVPSRAYPDARAKDGTIDRKRFDYFFTAAVHEIFDRLTPAELAAWYRRHRGVLRGEPGTGLLEVDSDLVKLGARHDDLDSLIGVAKRIDDPGGAEVAARVLARYLPEGPVGRRDAAVWSEWIEGRRDNLFFSDPGGFRWYLDAFAKRRGVPSKDLLGTARATRPWPSRVSSTK